MKKILKIGDDIMDNLKKYTIVIDQGHGGNDPGAVDKEEESQGDFILTIEKDLNKRVGDKVIAKLKALQANVVVTRPDDKSVSLGERCRIANNSKAHLFVSIHFNAGSCQASGIETFIYRDSKNPITKKLGENLQSEFIKDAGLKNRGLKTSGFYVLKNTNMPAALIEVGFITNTKEEQIINKEEIQDKIATSIVNAKINTLGG